MNSSDPAFATYSGPMKYLFLTFALVLAAPSFAIAQEAPADRKEQFIIVLRPVPRLVEAENWTEEDERIVGEHFGRLKRLTAEGTVILAGRTMNEDSTMFGIVIFEAASAEEARRLMEEDPAVREGIMTAELFPYRIALQRRTE